MISLPQVSCATWQNCIHSVVVFMVEVCTTIHMNSHVPVMGHFFFFFVALTLPSSVQLLCPPQIERETLHTTKSSGFLLLSGLCHLSHLSWTELGRGTVH